MIRRNWFRVHSLAGVFGGLLLFVVCWSGTVATLSAEIDWVLNPALRSSAAPRPLDWDRIATAAQRAFPDGQLSWITAPKAPDDSVDVVLERPTQGFVHVYMDETGVVRGTSSYLNVQRFFRNLHMTLFLPVPLGTYIVGLTGVCLLVLVVTPLVFYRRWWARFLQFKAGNTRRSLYSELHKIGGLWSMWFVLLIGLTGVWYMAEQLSIDIADATFVYPPPPEWKAAGDARLSLNELVAAAQRARPELRIAQVSLSPDLVAVNGQAGDVLVRDRANTVYVDRSTGAVAFDLHAADLGALRRWVETVDLLHFGNFGGLPTKLLWFLFGAVLSGLCLTGAYLHAKRLAGVGARQARWAGMGTALAVSLGVLAATAAAGLVQVREYGPLVDGIRHWPGMPAGVVVFLLAWVASTLAAIALWLRFMLKRVSGVAPRSWAPEP